MNAPFRQLPYDAVPERPRVPHPYFTVPARTVAVRTPHFGAMDLQVRVHGAGPPLLLVHGFMTTGYSFRYVLEPLGRTYTLYVPDLPGCGRSDKPDAPYTPEAMADALAALLAALDIRGCAVLGNSMGGYLAMHLALRDPGAMRALVNLHSPGIPTARMWALRAALDVVPGAYGLVRRLVWRDPQRWVHRNVHYYDETLKSREEHREYGDPLATSAGVRAFARMLDETMDVRAMARFRDELARRGRFPVPLQLVYARRDPMVPPAVGEALRALLPDARFERIERGSHFAHVDAPGEFLALAAPFLARHTSVG